MDKPRNITRDTLTKRAERLIKAIAERTNASNIKINKYGICDAKATFVSYTADDMICDSYHSKYDSLADAIADSQQIITFKLNNMQKSDNYTTDEALEITQRQVLTHFE